MFGLDKQKPLMSQLSEPNIGILRGFTVFVPGKNRQLTDENISRTGYVLIGD